MSDSAAPPDIFNVYEIAEEGGPDALIGEAEYAADGMLTLTGGLPDKADFLRDVFGRVNAKASLSKLIGPAPGAERFALGTETVTRDDPAFFDALQEYLTKYFGVRLG